MVGRRKWLAGTGNLLVTTCGEDDFSQVMLVTGIDKAALGVEILYF